MITFAPGGPQPAYRFAAISLGSQCGIGNGLAPYAELVRSEGHFFLNPLYIARRTYKSEVIVNALPNRTGPERISSIKVTVDVRVLGVTYRVGRGQVRYFSPPNVLAWDGLPGGTSSIAGQVGGQAPNGNLGILWPVGGGISTALAGDFCFVPTASALDLQDVTDASVTAAHVNGTSSVSQSRANVFIAQNQLNGLGNQAHPGFNARNGRWLFNELQNPPGTPNDAACTTECTAAPLAVAGPAGVCPGTQGTFSVANQPPNTAVAWSVGPAGAAVPSSGTGPAFSFAPAAGYSGPVTVQTVVTTTGGCGNFPALAKSVYVGPAEVGFTAQGDCAGQVSTFRAHGGNTLGDYRWTIDNVARPEFDGLAEISYTLPADGRTQLPVSIAASSACPGGGPVSVQAVAVVTTAAGCANQRVAFTPYPNPADDQVTVQAQAAPGRLPLQAFQVQLHDAQGRPVRQQPAAAGRAVLDTHTLAPGLYHLIIRHGRHGVERLNLHIAR